jgi:hypothetical protein
MPVLLIIIVHANLIWSFFLLSTHVVHSPQVHTLQQDNSRLQSQLNELEVLYSKVQEEKVQNDARVQYAIDQERER